MQVLHVNHLKEFPANLRTDLNQSRGAKKPEHQGNQEQIPDQQAPGAAKRARQELLIKTEAQTGDKNN
jgi:hypothetical protein